MYCYKCGNELQDGAIFCSYCGANQIEGESQPTIPNEPPKDDTNKREKVKKLYQQGWSINEIAKALKMDENLVSFYCGGKKNEGDTSYSSSSGEQKNMESSPIRLDKKIIKYIIITVVVLIALLPFHFAIGYGNFGIKIFPKDHLTFEHTIITGGDVQRLITRYNNANIFDRLQIQNEQFFKKLMEEGIIYREGREGSSTTARNDNSDSIALLFGFIFIFVITALITNPIIKKARRR